MGNEKRLAADSTWLQACKQMMPQTAGSSTHVCSKLDASWMAAENEPPEETLANCSQCLGQAVGEWGTKVCVRSTPT